MPTDPLEPAGPPAAGVVPSDDHVPEPSSPAGASHLTVRSFWAALPVEGRWLLSTTALQTLGRGMTLPFTVVYLHEVRHFRLDLAGALMAGIALLALILGAPGGTLVDRYGARLAILAGSGVQIVGTVLMAFVTTPAMAWAAVALYGASAAVGWSSFNVLIASVVEGDLRQQYFGINFALINLGIGVGGILAGLIADVSRPATFSALFLIDAAVLFIPIALLLGPLRHVHGKAAAPDDESADKVGYLQILRRPALTWLTILTFVATFVGYGQMEAGVPAFARAYGHVSTEAIGWSFAVNTATIVCLQFLVLRRLSGRRRTRIIVVFCGIWAVSWLVFSGAAAVPGSTLAVVCVLAFSGIFALGETLMQPSLPALVNDLAPDHLRGRYNALMGIAFSGGSTAGPLLAGVLLQHRLGALFIGLMLVGLAIAAALALVVERRITAAINGVPAPS